MLVIVVNRPLSHVRSPSWMSKDKCNHNHAGSTVRSVMTKLLSRTQWYDYSV